MVNGNDWFDDFVVESQCDETNDLGWLDRMHYSKQIARLVDDTSNNPLLVELDTVCNDVLGVDQIIVNGDKTSKRFRSANTIFASKKIASPIASNEFIGVDPMVELRYNLFGKMLGHYASNVDAKFISAEDFDKCFKGS